MFDPAYPIAQLKPASYNPRLIDEESLARLQDSLRTLGLIKPVIVTDEGTLVAGHQRTKSMQLLGITICPAFVLHGVNYTDEIRFNQLHNAADLEIAEDARLRVTPQTTLGFVDLPADTITGPLVAKNVSKRQEILQLLTRYGQWGSIVVTQSGEILVSALYAIASKILGYPCKAYVVEDSQRETVLHYFGQSYGQFSYSHLPKTTWSQSLAQKFRLRTPGEDSVTADTMRSRIYETIVIPAITKTTRILDFGAGQMDYAKKLRSEGYNIRGIEFYFRKGTNLYVNQVQRDITDLCNDLTAHGRYDFVVCDSVINSVDSLQAEADVMTCLNALCKPGGIIAFSGRNKVAEMYMERSLKSYHGNQHRRKVQFFDKDGFTAIFMQGVWLYQKMHDKAEIQALLTHYFPSSPATIGVFASQRGQRGKSLFQPVTQDELPLSRTYWGVKLTKRQDLPLADMQAALSREFDLPLPEQRSYRRSQDILAAWEKARGME